VIAPLVHRVHVKAAPARAFELFASRMADWWPRGQTIGAAPHAQIIIEPRAGGRWFERDDAGNETQWGQVLDWEPPRRLLLDWQIGTNWRYDAALHTEVELTFVAAEDGGTVVTLEHRNLERFGANAATHAATLNGGWPGFVAGYGRFTDANS
jgi:uncharacterized protein YndB with AHSA1/START domain